jgi:hypothetical protein
MVAANSCKVIVELSPRIGQRADFFVVFAAQD